MQELLERLHGRVEPAMTPFALVAMRLTHAARSVEDDLDVRELPLDFGWLEGDGVSQEQDRHGEQAGRQAVGDEHEATQEPAAAALDAIIGHRQGLTGADPLPEGQDDRQGEQGQPLRMQEGHGRTATGGDRC